MLLLDTGDKVVADGVMAGGHNLVIDEASLTGESDPIKKSRDEDPWCRSGTQVSEGSGRVLIVAVGPQSEWGRTLALVGGAGDDETPLQEKLGDMAATIGKVGLGVAVASFAALTIKWFVVWCRSPGGCAALRHHLNQGGLVEFFLYAVTIVVVAVPEGLPLAVTIALAYSMKKMMRDNNFVRVLAACETMGGATAICSDKTGTLTENRMTVTEGWFAGAKLDHAPARDELGAALLEELALNFALNSKAHLIVDAPPPAPVGFVGNRTECALLALARRWGFDYGALRAEWAPRVAREYGFTSARKMASVLVSRLWQRHWRAAAGRWAPGGGEGREGEEGNQAAIQTHRAPSTPTTTTIIATNRVKRCAARPACSRSTTRAPPSGCSSAARRRAPQAAAPRRSAPRSASGSCR